MTNLNDLRFFVAAVESGGFTAAARQLAVPKSTVSKRVAELEQSLGVRLLHRSSRSFSLTDVGREVFERARAAVIEAEAAEAAARRRLAEPSGAVRLTTSVPTAQFQLAGHLPALALAFPKIELQLHVTDRFVDLVQEGFDLAIRSHFAPLPDSGLVQRRLGVETIVAVAAPAYLESFGEPRHPEELGRHRALPAAPGAVWTLRDEKGQEVRAAPPARFVADESRLLLEAATAGLGIACLPASFCRHDLAAGRLRRVLAGWTAGEVVTTLLLPHRRGQLPAVRAVVDFLTERFAADAAAF